MELLELCEIRDMPKPFEYVALAVLVLGFSNDP
jgi:hypothetical protein